VTAPDPGRLSAGSDRRPDVEATHRAYGAYSATVATIAAIEGDEPPDGGGSRSSRHQQAAYEGPVRRFVRRYGWRAYALPLLAVVTVVALTTAGEHDHGTSASPRTAPGGGVLTSSGPAGGTVSAPPTATGDQALKTDNPGADSLNTVLQSDALPAGGSYTAKGAGTFTVLPGSGPVIGTGTVRHYTIEVENGITGIDLTAFATTVQAVLSDSRSWTAGAGVALQRVASGPVSFHVTLTSSMTVRTLCGYEIPIETSCFAPAGQNGSQVNRVVLNDARWVRGDAAYIGDLAEYRIYMVNHESGHALGHLHAHNCLSNGLAPAMMQQTIGLKAANGQICQANPWPYPPGAANAPGVEAPDSQVNNEFNLQNE
jgi:Protein of unknown function (DUF3152)